MVVIDYDNVDDFEDFSPVPEGYYYLLIDDIEINEEGTEDEWWNVTLVIQKGKYTNRKIWDRWHFTEKALVRIKLICKRLGMPAAGQIDLRSEMFIGKEFIGEVCQEEYIKIDEEGNEVTRTKNKLTFAGYYSTNDEAIVEKLEKAEMKEYKQKEKKISKPESEPTSSYVQGPETETESDFADIPF